MLVPWDELSKPAYGNGTQIGSAIQQAGAFLCDMYQRFPRWLFPDPTGFGALVQGISDQLCSGTPVPPPLPYPPIPGGKCFCVTYRISWISKLFAAPAPGSIDVKGPVTVLGYETNETGLLQYSIVAQNNTCTAPYKFAVISNFTAEDFANGLAYVQDVAIVRLDGLPDTCGDQVPRPDPIIPTVPDLNRVVPIVIAPSVTIFTPITLIRPTLAINLDANVNINVQPTFNFPDIGLNIGFDIGGVNINNSFNIGGASPPIPLPDPRDNPPKLPPGQNTDVDLTKVYKELDEIKDELDAIKQCACDEYTLTAQTLDIGNSGEVSLPPNTQYVRVQITTTAPAFKRQNGVNGPDVLHAGWAWFRVAGNGLSEREPIDNTQKVFFAPQGSNSFAWTVYAGGVATITAYKRTTT